MAVKKAIFVVAGFGTRFLPITKAVPKEMLPIVDKPIIQYLVEEAVEAGIEYIIFVTGRGKNSIENHFDKSYELEHTLVEKKKAQLVKEVEKISKLANFAYVRQAEQKGDGHAMLFARPFIDPTESVLIVFPDYLMPAKNKTFRKMMEAYREFHEPVIATDSVPMEQVSKYGVMKYEETANPDLLSVTGFVEKPKTAAEAPSNLIANGYYIVTPEIWKYLDSATSTTGDGEIRLADALTKYTSDSKKMYAVKPEFPGYDCGTKSGFLRATIDIALEREDLREEVMAYLRTKVENK